MSFESELKHHISNILDSSHLDEISMKSVFEKLTVVFGDTWLEHKTFVREQVKSLLAAKNQENQNEKEEKDEKEEKEERKKNKVYHLAEGLAKLLNQTEMSRGDAKEKLRNYVESNNLRNGENVVFDDAMKKAFSKESANLEELDDLVEVSLLGRVRKSEVKTNKRSFVEIKEKGKEKSARGAFQKPYCLSPALAELLQTSYLSRANVVKALWVYIKSNNLQDPKNRKKIICDDALTKVMHSKTVDMLAMNTKLTKELYTVENSQELERAWRAQDEYLNGHLGLVSDHEYDDGSSEAEEEEDDVKEPTSKKSKLNTKKESKGKKSKEKSDEPKNAKPLRLSTELSAIVGTNFLSRGNVVKYIWVYIRAHGLQDPSDKRNIKCDSKLMKVMDNKKVVTIFTMNKFLPPHFENIEDSDEMNEAIKSQNDFTKNNPIEPKAAPAVKSSSLDDLNVFND